MLTSLLLILAGLIGVIIYLYLGLVCLGKFWWCFGIPHRNTFKQKLSAFFIQFGIVLFWPIFHLMVAILTVSSYVQSKRKRS